MSTSGQGDQTKEVSKDDEGEIYSTSDNGGINPCSSKTNSEAVPVAVSSSEPLELGNEDSTVISSEDSRNEACKLDIDLNVASSNANLRDEDLTTKSVMEVEEGSGDRKTISVPKVADIEEEISQESTDFNLEIEPKPVMIKEINEIIQADVDKDSSSVGEELELRWDEDDDENDDDVLKQLDEELKNIDAIHQDDNEIKVAKNTVTLKSQQENVDESIVKADLSEVYLKSFQNKSSDVKNDDQNVQLPSVDDTAAKAEYKNKTPISIDNINIEQDDVEMPGSSFENNQKNTEQIDYTMKGLIGKVIDSTMSVENPKINDQTYSLTIENQDNDLASKKETELETNSSQNLEKMDVDTVKVIQDPTVVKETVVAIEDQKHCEVLDEEVQKVIDTTEDSVVNTDIEKSKSNVLRTDPPIAVSSCDKEPDTIDSQEVTLKAPVESKPDTNIDDSEVNDKIESHLNSTLDTTITPNLHHRINKPNVMLDIPTQDLSDIEADLESDSELYNEAKTQNTDYSINDSLTDIVKDAKEIKIEESLNTDLADDINMKETIKICTGVGVHLITSTPDSIDIVRPAIEIDGTTSKLNITIVSPKNLETSLLESKTHLDSTSKREQSKVESKGIKNQRDTEESEFDDEKPSTSKVTQVDDEKPTPKTIQDADGQKPSTSKPDTSSLKLTPDNTDSVQEVTDSLGLLAESSRVMDDDNEDDDDEDGDDQEADDNDDDEDFDPYEESNSAMAEDMEDSNTPPPELDPKMDKPGPPEEREFDEGTMDTTVGSMDITEGTMDIVDDIECVENELPGLDDAASETPSNEEIAEKEDETEIIDADTHTGNSTKLLPEKIINILEKVLGQHGTGSKTKDASPGHVRSYVELEGSSDSDDVLEVSKSEATKSSDVISVNIPKEVEVMSTSGRCATSEIVSKEGEVIISGVPKPPPQKISKINTSEVTIKTTGLSTHSIHIPEATSAIPKEEIFSLDSDEEDTKKVPIDEKDEKASKDNERTADKKCMNPNCTSETQTYYQADRATAGYYSLTRRGAAVCEECRDRASERSQDLIAGIKDLRPLLELNTGAPSQQLVEISDSDSEGEGDEDAPPIGQRDAAYLEEHLADMINETWVKYKLQARLDDTEAYLLDEYEKMQASVKEIDAMLDQCQKRTDAVRIDFYKDYEIRRKTVGAIIIHDTPFTSYSHTESDVEEGTPQIVGSRYPKRKLSSTPDTPAKRPAIPMGYTPLEGDKIGTQSDSSSDPSKDDDKEDISVVKLSAESAPADLPPCGEIVRPPLKVGMIIYAMRNAFGTWLKGRIMDVQPKAPGQQFTQCRVKFEHKIKNPCKVLAARCLAYPEPSEVRMTIGTRVVALFKDPHNTARRDSFYSGVIAEIPNPVNSYRYLVFFDDGYAQYVPHQHTRIVCESSSLVWEEVHPFIRDFICNYLLSYPERPMVRLHAGEKLKTEWNGKWWDSRVLKVDASIALINFDEDNRTEWIYRGSTRLAPLYLELQAAEKAGEGRGRSRLPRSKAQMRSNMPCVEYTRSDEQASAKATVETHALQQHNEEMRRQRAVAKKSTTAAAAPHNAAPCDGVISRVVYYTPKNAVRPHKMVPHTCGAACRRTDLLSLKDLKSYNPLAKPLLSGWERQTVRYKGHRAVVYRAPCGRRVRNMPELHRYLRALHSELAVDLFDFTPGTHCLAEFVLHKCNVSKKDLSHGKENVPVPCVNYYDESLPEFCSYNTERTPTAGVPLNLDPDFLCGCDCTDDCMDQSKCACWKMTLEGAKTIGLEGPNVGYVYRRLPEPLPSGIYECNSRCKCKQTCLNRVAQHPLQLKLQVFKTINRGWGIRALNDVPKGSFLCVYAGNLLTDATANLDGLNEGDEYLAELDYIEVVEAMKEGYEDDVPDADKQLDKKSRSSASESEPSESDEEQDTAEDGDFQPGYITHTNMEFRKSLRKRQKAKKKEQQEMQKQETKKRDDCITISDDEEVREPSRFTAQAGMVDRDLITKQSSRVSVRTLFGKDEACYIMDAKVQGNIGRYLNHSCHPNVFVQNVFVDTHDPRFPWVAFFALAHVRAGTELTWNYNYDVGSVPEKVLYCYCGAPNCRGRLL